MSERKPSPFPVLLNNDVCSLIQAAEDVYQIRFKNRAANAYLVRGSKRTILIDVGLSSNFPQLQECGTSLARGIPDGPELTFDKIQLTLQGAIDCAQKTEPRYHHNTVFGPNI